MKKDNEKYIQELEHRALDTLIEAILLIRPECNPNGDETHYCETCVFNNFLIEGICGKLFLSYWASDMKKKAEHNG